jgi:hypothetical protein
MKDLAMEKSRFLVETGFFFNLMGMTAKSRPRVYIGKRRRSVSTGRTVG